MMWSRSLLSLPIVFAGILGVIGIFEDAGMWLGHEPWEASRKYLKYHAAFLGALGYALVLYRQSKTDQGA
jgi:hypothetical protein